MANLSDRSTNENNTYKIVTDAGVDKIAQRVSDPVLYSQNLTIISLLEDLIVAVGGGVSANYLTDASGNILQDSSGNNLI
jgi:hypothetical protein